MPSACQLPEGMAVGPGNQSARFAMRHREQELTIFKVGVERSNERSSHGVVALSNGFDSLAAPRVHRYRTAIEITGPRPVPQDSIMDRPQLNTLSEPAELDALYLPPSPMIQKAVTQELTHFHQAYLRVASFFCLSTGSDRGLDATPRGGPPGFVRVLDKRTLAFADWPGNNRIESLRNLLEDDRAALLFLFPGLDVFLRINGRAHISTEPTLLAALAEGQRQPKCAIVVAVEEVLFHCGKAINRAKLWDAASHIDRKTLPSVGTMLAALAELKDVPPEALDAHYDTAVKTELY